ncbi:MAG: response regulator [Acidobacteriota bacterium]
MLDLIGDGILTVDAGGHIRSFNPAAERLFGWSQAEVLGQPVNVLMKDTGDGWASASRADPRRASPSRLVGSGREVTGQRRDGATFPMDLRISRVEGDDEILFTAVVRDCTDLAVMEARLRQSQRMEALGHLVAGVAHDFNNLLTIIGGNCEALRVRGGLSEAQGRSVAQMSVAADQATALAAQLVAFSRAGALEPKVLDLNASLRQVAQLLKRTLGEDIAVEMRLEPRALHVRMDPAYTGQLMVNLAVNARDAMPAGGSFTITTRVVSLDPRDATNDHPPGEYARLDVRDNGAGMSEDVRVRAFEPFFTTKAGGRGSGLGLATVFGIVARSEGRIELHSAPGCGTHFIILLPLAVEEEVPDRAGLAAPALLPTGDETVLLVEDEPAVRDIVATMLRDLGYHTLEAGSADEALSVAEDLSPTIDLLVTDVVLPELSGRQLAERLRRLAPSMKVLFMSGYTDDAVLARGVERLEVAFLPKPFTRAALAHGVRELLAQV